MNLLDAARNTVHDSPGGASALAIRMGKSASVLSHELTATGTAKLGLMDAEKIIYFTGDLRIVQAMATNAGQMLVPLPLAADVDADDCMLRLAATVKEFSDLCTEVAGDLKDSQITDNELSRVDRECGELIASIHSLREALARRNQAGKPVQMRAVS